MRQAAPSVHHPYKGHVYLATSPTLQAKGQLKYGETFNTTEERARGHAGQLTDEKSEILFSLYSLDSLNAEALARELFRVNCWHVQGRKEFVTCTFEEARAVLLHAVEKCHVRTQPLLVPVNVPVLVQCANTQGPSAPWDFLLSQPLHIGNSKQTVGEWMAKSLKCTQTTRKLASRGIFCVNWDELNPIFQVQRLDSQLDLALRSRGFSAQDLFDPTTGAPDVELTLQAQ